jgi:hypothetical protein
VGLALTRSRVTRKFKEDCDHSYGMTFGRVVPAPDGSHPGNVQEKGFVGRRVTEQSQLFREDVARVLRRES